MNPRMLLPLLATTLLTGCLVAPNAYGGLSVIPVLPFRVEIGDDGHYAHGGYRYRYVRDCWYVAPTRGGAWVELPRSHWPREIRRRGGRRW